MPATAPDGILCLVPTGSRQPLHLGESVFFGGTEGPFAFSYEYDSAAYIKLLEPSSLSALTAGQDFRKFARRLGMGAARKDYSLPLEPPPDKVLVLDENNHARLVMRWGEAASDTAVFALGDIGQPLRSVAQTFGSLEVVLIVGPDSYFGGQVAYAVHDATTPDVP